MIHTTQSEAPEASTDIKTTCAYCGVGCGIRAVVNKQKQSIEIKGDEQHPANFGRLCSKGSALGETLNLSNRLLEPEIHNKVVTWDEALDEVASRFKNVIDEHGPDAVAFYGSGQLLTEDYYVANKLMKGFIGSANIDTNSRLCMASAVAGHKRAFGSDTVPNCYEDIEHTNLIVIIGSNTAWCHPIVFQRIRAAKEKNPKLKVVVVDPRRTNTCDIADLHLPIAIGSDVKLFNGLLSYLEKNQALDKNYIAQYTDNFDTALAQAKADSQSIEDVARYCDIEKSDVKTFYQWFSQTDLTMSLFSMGVKQSSSGVDKVNSILNCHLATGRIGKKGAGPLSLTGQPNAMGGREVGGLANQLAAHMDFNKEDIDRVARFWGSKHIATQPGLPAVELFEQLHSKKIKAIWIMATNPAVSLPNADKVKEAIKNCDFVVVSDCASSTDTLDLAHVKLPALGWSEKDGMVTNSERCISRQRALFKPAGNAKPDWWIISKVAQRLGFEKNFNYIKPVDIFKEHARLSAFENAPSGRLRDFNIGALSDMSDEQYENFAPTMWPLIKSDDTQNNTHQFFEINQTCDPIKTAPKRFFSQGDFFTANRKAKFIGVTTKKPKNAVSDDYPLILNTGRIRDQWHTMTRTALAPRLNQHKSEPFVEVHPQDALRYKLSNNNIARLSTQWGTMLCRVDITRSQKQGSIFVPMHWTEQYANQGRMGACVNPAVDPVSGQPESKHTPVKLSYFDTQCAGFILSRKPLTLHCDYVVKIHCDGFYRYEIATEAKIKNPKMWLEHKTGFVFQKDAPLQEFDDIHAGIYRASLFKNGHLTQLVCLAKNFDEPFLPARGYLSDLFTRTNETDNKLNSNEQAALLSGVTPVGVEDTGKTICACFNVGEKTILKCINKGNLTRYQQVGEACKAGTNCGSCVPEIKSLLETVAVLD